jgi:asparagine synthase (glutamine-hydrolysing)
MCGIAGFFELSSQGDEGVLRQMTDTMTHRGPDDKGYQLFRSNDFAVGLGQRRLSIIDLSPRGHQPMSLFNLTITYNGEIYNFKEVRNELQRAGYAFQSDSDTEVILAAFHRWGPASMNKFRGMWAFAIWDQSTQKLFLCRDRMGVKPLYWYKRGNVLLFGSELKSFHKHPGFLKEINSEALGMYFKYSYVPSPHCIFGNTEKLAPGTYLEVNSKLEIQRHTYWNIDDYYTKGHEEKRLWMKRPVSEIAEELEQILTEGFKLRMVSDVPVGMFLSGGIDSSLVTALLQKEYTTPLKTFTIGFHEKKYNEADWAKKIAKQLGTDHTELYCSPKEAFEVIGKLSDIYDEPFGDSSAIPTYLVSALARRHVTVALSADGGDEQFCGYPRYLKASTIHSLPYPLRRSASLLMKMISPATISSIYSKLRPGASGWHNLEDKYAKFVTSLGQRKLTDEFDALKSYFRDNELVQMKVKPVSKNVNELSRQLDSITELMRVDMSFSLTDDMLVKVDRASMAVGLESREPFLDNKIIEYSSQMPSSFKYHEGKTKYILRKILYKYISPELVDRKKMGFEVPIHDWFKNDLKPIYENYLSEDRIKREGLFDSTYVKALTSRYFDGKPIDAHKLWLLCTFEMWREKWM